MDVAELEARVERARSLREFDDVRYRLYVARARQRRAAGEGEEADWEEYRSYGHDRADFIEKAAEIRNEVAALKEEALGGTSVADVEGVVLAAASALTYEIRREREQEARRALRARIRPPVAPRTPVRAGRVVPRKPKRTDPSPVEKLRLLARVPEPEPEPEPATVEALRKKVGLR